MFLANIENEKLVILLCAVTIIAYFLIMYFKKKIIGNKTKNWIRFIDIFINITLLCAALITLAYLTGNLSFNETSDKIWDILTKQTSNIIGSGFVLVICATIYSTIKMIAKGQSSKRPEFEKRRRTLAKVLVSCTRYVIYIVGAIVILSIWGVDVMPVFAGLGIAGIVIGLGAQKLIGDFINGLFIIFEQHFNVGDIIEVEGFKGEVIDIGLKTTRIKNWKGEVKIIANGNISDVTNFSLDNSVAVVEFKISYEENVNNITELLNRELPLRCTNMEYLLTKPQVIGTTNFDDSWLSMRVTATTVSECHYGIERAIRQQIKEIFDENGINIPIPQIRLGDENHE